MNHELSVFLITAALTGLAGGFIRGLALRGNQALLRLEVVDFARDFITAAAAVFPTTLILQVDPHKEISMTPIQMLAIIFTVAMIFIWGVGESRYFSDWREGKKKNRLEGGELSAAMPAAHPRLWKALAFVVSNGMGFAVLFGSTVLSQQIAS